MWTHRQFVDRPNLLSYRENIQQRLCRVLSNPVPSVDHRLHAILGGFLLMNRGVEETKV